jgi:serine/threonine-protein kinase
MLSRKTDMITTDLPTLEAFLADLDEYKVLDPKGLESAHAYHKAHPGRSSDDLATHLIENDLLTRFQAQALLQGEADKLVLAHYVLVDEIGSGSMGTVFKARSTKDDALFAIKIVSRRNVVNLRSVTEKVESLKQVRHPRVSAMIHVGAQGERAYMVWPLLEGGEKLDAIVNRQGRLNPKGVAQIGLQIAMGLQAYHEHDLFHGLLKANDILIGADRRVRILDFGVGFLLTCERGKALLDTTTNSKALARGLDCTSPEAIMDPLNRTVASDQYSLGCILYFCLSGQYPFVENNPVKKMLAHQFNEPKPLRQLVPDCPPKLAAVVRRMLAKQAEDRYSDMGEVVTELQAIASDTRIGVSLPASKSPVTPTTPIPAPPIVPSGSRPAIKTKTALAGRGLRGLRGRSAGLWLTLAGVVGGVTAGVITWLLMHS